MTRLSAVRARIQTPALSFTLVCLAIGCQSDPPTPDGLTSRDGPLPDTAADLAPDKPSDRGLDVADDVEGPTDQRLDAPCFGDASRSCYSGATGTKGVGTCKAGTQLCIGDKWGPCIGEVTPTTEVCDNLDNDCDSATDENVTQACYTGQSGTKGVGLCKGGTQTCSAGKWGTCTGEVTPTLEVCDNIDNDCDKATDEGMTKNCYSAATSTLGVGLCKAGTSTCAVGKWGTCTGEVTPTVEACDNQDNDCDSFTDEGLLKACYTAASSTLDVGVCKAGKAACSAGKWGSCNGEITPSTETCDNQDNDCDGFKDENLSKQCYTGALGTAGVGLCKAGTTQCSAGNWGACVGEIIPTAEVCDNKDNDCNKVVDDGLTQNCYTGKSGTQGVGLCKSGIKTCAKGTWSSCVGEIVPTAEKCDNKDNDCDKVVDNGLARACYTGKAGTQGVGLCKAGTETCAKGTWGSCIGEIVPATEKCDSKDNDCDKAVDEDGATGCINYYYDNDGDGWGSAKVCSCSQPTGTVYKSGDCYDGGGWSYFAHPGQTQFFNVPIFVNTSLFDYNCDGKNEGKYKGTSYCDTSACKKVGTGFWYGSIPACGQEGFWITSCIGTPASCTFSYAKEKQFCR